MPWTKQFDVNHALERAMHQFWAHGFTATSIQDLVREMGVNRGSLYDTYGGKRDLFLSALRRYDERCRKTCLDDLEAHQPPRRAIEALFHGWRDAAASGAGRNGCFLTNTALELASHDDEIGAIVASGQRETEAFFRRLVERGQRDGSIRAELDPDQIASALLTSFLGLLVLVRSRPEPELLRGAIEGALRILD